MERQTPQINAPKIKAKNPFYIFYIRGLNLNVISSLCWPVGTCLDANMEFVRQIKLYMFKWV